VQRDRGDEQPDAPVRAGADAAFGRKPEAVERWGEPVEQADEGAADQDRGDDDRRAAWSPRPDDRPRSMPGTISEKKDAASITPAAKPIRPFSSRALGLPMPNSGRAPRTVARPAARLPRKPVSTIEKIGAPFRDRESVSRGSGANPRAASPFRGADE
jgi:hypothetical protein